MDCPSSPAGHMFPSSGQHRSCTTQSDPVKPVPDFAGEDTNMVMSPQQMSQPCESLTDHYSHGLAPSYLSRQQNNSYTSSEPLAYHGSPLLSQVPSRHQTWAVPQASTWAGEASHYAYTSAAAPRDHQWNSLGHGAVQSWIGPHQQYQQPAFQTEYQHAAFRSSAEQLPRFGGQRESIVTAQHATYYPYLSMSPAASQAPDYSLEGYSGAVGSTVSTLVQYRRGHDDSPSSPRAGGGPLLEISGQAMSSSQQGGQADTEERMQSPLTPKSDYDDEPADDYYAKAERESLSPSVVKGERSSSAPASPNKPAETPYAQLIYQAFMGNPRRALKLQEIYQWFLENTDKGQPGTGKGWQNSIRHNLSMNGAFQRRPIKGEAADGDCCSPSGTSKQATEWFLLESAQEKGVESTTRFRNSARRAQNKRLHGRSRADTSSRRSSRRQPSSRTAAQSYSLPPVSRYDPRNDRSQAYYGQYAPSYGTGEDQLERLSLASSANMAPSRDFDQRRGMYYSGDDNYEQAQYHTAPMMGSPMETYMQGSYSSAPVSYSSELFMPSVPGAPTVASEDDVNEVITPEPSFSVLEPTVLLPGDTSSTNHGPTSDPYNGGGSAYFNTTTAADSHGAPRYTLGDVAGVCDEDMLRSCGWNANQASQQ